VGTTFLATVPAGYKWILRDIVWFQPASGLDAATAVLVETGGGVNVSGFNLAPGTNSNLVVDSPRFIVMGPGSVLEAQSVSVAGTTIYISGNELILP
jgi:hypothetical protein